MDKKDVCFLGSSKEDIIAFPFDAKREAGYQLGLVQAGEEPNDWKPFSDIGAGVKEIRIHKIMNSELCMLRSLMSVYMFCMLS